VVTLDPSTCYRALLTRDARFDGRFFTAVKTTGIFCRPICPARTPKRSSCSFFLTAAAALEAGYRPCLRCRPEASPGSPAWSLTSTTVARAVRLIGDGALDSGSVDDLAARVGLGARHLRSLFHEHLGASPLAIATSRRVLFAKKLLDETTLPITDVALSSGFQSVRRFNAAMSAAYGRPPRAIRRRVAHEERRARKHDAFALGDAALSLELAYREPYDFAAVMRYLAPRAIPAIESTSPRAWHRSFSIGGALGSLVVEPRDGHLALHVAHAAPAALIDVVDRVRAVFDLATDSREIARTLARDPELRARLRRARGLRVPGAFSGFELAVRAILGQQVSVAGATTIAGRLVREYGNATGGAGG
jgi:AraC family transcriptional regulator of adaptative response / DNA-3-methyladenine glycosylase II